MKRTIGLSRPDSFKPEWPGQYDLFSHFEFACGIPQVLYAITTYKQNGLPNVCPHAWSTFVGGKDGYFAVLGGLMERTHTYHNILRGKCFCINFLPPSYYDALLYSISNNEEETDEFAVCGFSAAPCETIAAPSISESFLTLECELTEETKAVSGALSLLIGKALCASFLEGYASGIDKKYGKEGFAFNIHSPIDLETGICDRVGLATLQIDRVID
jgi:flavin reductase (DIM6/NTAB) family NADH-FMN oxidoreductase RutF